MIINKTLLAKYSPLPIPDNFDYADLLPYVTVAESIWVKPLIGDELYDEIDEQVENNNISETNATLLVDGLLWQYLAFAAILEALPTLWLHFSEAGITKGNSENSESATLKDMTYVQAHIRQQVEVLKDMVKKFLCEHSDSFPSMDCCACGCDCCQHAKLNDPNPYQQLYATRHISTDIK